MIALKNKWFKLKKRFKLFISFKSRYIYGNYLFIKSKYWYGCYKWNTECPNFKSQGITYIFCKWNITKIK